MPAACLMANKVQPKAARQPGAAKGAGAAKGHGLLEITSRRSAEAAHFVLVPIWMSQGRLYA
eukprot:1154903-Pelagomonas_calceolata.AAC.3